MRKYKVTFSDGSESIETVYDAHDAYIVAFLKWTTRNPGAERAPTLVDIVAFDQLSEISKRIDSILGKANKNNIQGKG